MILDESLKTWQFQRLKHALQALAAPADVQVRLFPAFVHTSDELMLDFDNFCGVVLGNYGTELAAEKTAILRAINLHLDSYPESAEGNEALKNHLFWVQTRVLALRALDVFGWRRATPPTEA